MSDTYYPDLIRKLRNRRVCIQATGNLNDHGLLKDAADAIEELQKQCKNWEDTACDWRDAYHHWLNNYMRDVCKWVSVSEKLPKEYKFVLCFTDEHDMFLATYLGLDGDGEPIFDDYHGDYWEGSVTHWQHLPQPPLYCLTCKHYIGMGDWSLCCDLKYDLCYENTPACDKYEEKPNDE